jgi:Zn-dependent protease
VRRLRDPQVLVAIGLLALAAYGLRHAVGSDTLILFLVAVPSIILHEIAHGVVALACGDDTAKRAGRLTLNPLRHIDPLGTIVLPAVLALSGLGAFGYAKPVPVNPARMRHPRNDAVVVTLAGPATNVALAGLSIAVLRLADPAGVALIRLLAAQDSLGAYPILPLGTRILFLLGLLNVILAVFNAIPIPPLDGSVLIERLLPRSALPGWYQFRRYAIIGLVLVVLIDPGGFLGRILGPAESAWAHLLVRT